MAVVRIKDDSLIITVKVQPKSSKTGWGEILGQDSIQLRINAPPVDGAANKACIAYIAKVFKAPKSGVKILKGLRNRNKTVSVTGYDPTRLKEFLDRYGLTL